MKIVTIIEKETVTIEVPVAAPVITVEQIDSGVHHSEKPEEGKTIQNAIRGLKLVLTQIQESQTLLLDSAENPEH